MFSGTSVSLLLKYFLDRKYIFCFIPKDKDEEGFKFVMYSALGVIITSIFWVIEFEIDYLFVCEYFKYIGAILGLSLGHFIKFSLDKEICLL